MGRLYWASDDYPTPARSRARLVFGAIDSAAHSSICPCAPHWLYPPQQLLWRTPLPKSRLCVFLGSFTATSLTAIVRDIQLKGPDGLVDLAAATFKIHDESHTIGNALRWMLMKKYAYPLFWKTS